MNTSAFNILPLNIKRYVSVSASVFLVIEIATLRSNSSRNKSKFLRTAVNFYTIHSNRLSWSSSMTNILRIATWKIRCITIGIIVCLIRGRNAPCYSYSIHTRIWMRYVV